MLGRFLQAAVEHLLTVNRATARHYHFLPHPLAAGCDGESCTFFGRTVVSNYVEGAHVELVACAFSALEPYRILLGNGDARVVWLGCIGLTNDFCPAVRATLLAAAFAIAWILIFEIMFNYAVKAIYFKL